MRLLPVLTALLLTAAALAFPAGARAQWRAPCIHGSPSPMCHWWNATVDRVADGDTVLVRVNGDASRRIRSVRFVGINAMELHRYSRYAYRRRGDCHAIEATTLIERYVRRAHWRVRLAAQSPSSVSGSRLRRSVWVRSGSRWVDLGRLVMQHGLALWLENGIEYAHNLEYHVLAQQAADARRGLYDPTSCRYGPDQDIPIALSVNWDADGNDGGDHGAHLNGEWVEIRNLGSRNLPLGGWWLRDSGLIYGAPRKPGYVFPAGTVVPAGGSLRVHVGCGVNDLANAYWCRHSSVFENASYAPRNIGDGGYLFDPDGDLRAASMYPCVLDCTDPLQGKVRLDVHASTPEYVAITNTSAAPVDLRGYVVKLHMTGRLHSYVFGYVIGEDSQLNPGETMRLWIQHGGPAGRLVKNLDRRRRYVLPDGGGAIDLRTETDVLIGCSHWGRIHRCQ